NQHGPYAVGMSGEDARLFTAQRRTALVDGEQVDVGLVGDVVSVNADAVQDLIRAGRIPVVSTGATCTDAVVHNVHAVAAGGALAVDGGAEKLVALTVVEGLYSDSRHRSSLVSRIDADRLEKLLSELESGMVPQMEACLRAVRCG